MRIKQFTTSSISNVDDEEFYFGSDNDFWFIYDETTDDAFEFWTSDSDGAGLDAELVSIPSGGTTITVNNDLVVGNDLNVQNDLDVDNDLNVDGNAVVDGTVNIAANGLLSGGGADGKMILSNLAADQGVLFDTTTNGQLTLTDESSAALDLNVTGDLTVGGDTQLSSPRDGGLLVANSTGLQGVELDTTTDGALLFRNESGVVSTNLVIGGAQVYFGSSVTTLAQRIGPVSDRVDINGNYGVRFLHIGDLSTASRGLFEFGQSTANAELTGSSGVQYGISLGNATVPFEVNQSGTAGYHALHIDVTETATGSGDADLINAGVGGSSKFSVDNSGNIHFANAGIGCVNQTVAYSDFTDGGGLTGTLVLDEGIPDGAIVQQCILHTLTGFTGGANSTATITVGDGTDVDRYNTGTPDVYTSNASGVDMGAVSGTAWHDDAKNVTLTVTVDNDFSTVSAGSFKIGIYYYSP